MSGDVTDFLAEVPLFAGLDAATRERLASAAEVVHVPARAWLFHQGDAGDALYCVRTGRLHVVRDHEVVDVLVRGAAFGELALLQGGTRAAGVHAVRDAEVLKLSRGHFAALLADPPFAAQLLAALAERFRGGAEDPPAVVRVATLVGHASRPDPHGLAAELVAALPGLDVAVLGPDDLAGAEDPGAAARLLDRAERASDLVLLMVCAAEDSRWRAFATRQADRVLITTGRADAPPPATDGLTGADLVVWGRTRPGAAWLQRWHDRIAPPRVHQVADHRRADDVARLSRRLTGRAVGVVLSGGGARGLAHVGVLAALEEAGVPVDRLGGTSIGALISGLSARGDDAAAVEVVCRAELVRRRPFTDWTFPRHALIRAERGARMLRRVFGQMPAELLPRSWFAISCDLVSGEPVVHRRGLVRAAVGASVSLPGLAPPRWVDGRLLVDGGVVNNLPVDVMLADHEGPVIAVDVMRSWHGAFSATGEGGRPRMPGIVDTLAAASGIAGRSGAEETRRQASVLITPDLPDVGLLDWPRMDRCVAEGRRAAEVALDGWSPPA